MLHRKTIQHYDLEGHAHELTFSCAQKLPLLVNDDICGWLADAIRQAREKHSFYLWAYVLMPNHVHLLIMPHSAGYSTQKVLQSIKQPVGRRFINRCRGIGGGIEMSDAIVKAAQLGRFWQDGPGYDRNVIDLKTAFAMGDYIHNNPVRRGLTTAAEDWCWSSARSWAGLDEGPLRVDRDSMPAR